MRYPGFCGPSYTSQSKIAAFDRTVNWMPEKIESGTGKAAFVLYPTPGLSGTSLTVAGATSGRGGFAAEGQSFNYVIDGTFYRSGTVRGSVSNLSGGVVSILSNGDAGRQLLINADRNTYAYDVDTHVFTPVGSAATSIGFVNGYGLRLDSDRSEVSFSALEDFSEWDAGDIFQRNDASDKWKRLLVHHKEVWLFGAETTSVYYNSDDPDIPFIPISSAFLQIGIGASWSACVVGNAPMWLGQSADGTGIVYRASGYTPERVSTHAVEYAFQQIRLASSLSYSLAEGSTYQEIGHVFYELTFPADAVSAFLGATWVYDLTTGLWHERGEWNGLTYGCVDTRGHFPLGFNYTMSRTSGTVYDQSITYAVGATGVGIRRLRRAPHLAAEGKFSIYDRFQLDLEVGLGLATGQGSDPQVSLSWSNDGGQTFGAERTISAGKVGEYTTRAIWRKLGRSDDRIFQVVVSDPIVGWRIIDAYLDVRTER